MVSIKEESSSYIILYSLLSNTIKQNYNLMKKAQNEKASPLFPDIINLLRGTEQDT